MGGVIEAASDKLGIPDPKLTAAQMRLRSVRMTSVVGSVIGIALGCLLGMVPLLWIDNDKSEEKKQLRIIFSKCDIDGYGADRTEWPRPPRDVRGVRASGGCSGSDGAGAGAGACGRLSVARDWASCTMQRVAARVATQARARERPERVSAPAGHPTSARLHLRVLPTLLPRPSPTLLPPCAVTAT